ncbi:PqqD family protein [Scopulibacillus darangshiensis]|uniref:PqqD family protein n=1 Tax=Scopulibacillus darangshiensis TaxID=442528 RepID=UPI001050B86D
MYELFSSLISKLKITLFNFQFHIIVFKQPKENRFKLDDLGLFVLDHCNGQYTVEEMAELMENEFGEKAEPTLPRLVKFLQILDTNSIITFKSAGI